MEGYGEAKGWRWGGWKNSGSREEINFPFKWQTSWVSFRMTMSLVMVRLKIKKTIGSLPPPTLHTAALLFTLHLGITRVKSEMRLSRQHSIPQLPLRIHVLCTLSAIDWHLHVMTWSLHSDQVIHQFCIVVNPPQKEFNAGNQIRYLFLFYLIFFCVVVDSFNWFQFYQMNGMVY